jgi:cellulose 1,4-beta-cellobiosidase
MRLLAAVVVTCLTMATTTDPVAAQWSATSTTFTTQTQASTLAPPTSLSASPGCVLITIPLVTLNWTASGSTFTASYDILRSTTSGGPYSQIGSATGGATTTYTDSGSLLPLTTYHYVIRARLTNWLSTTTTQVSATTPLTCP